MKRRIILVVSIVLVVGLLAGGITWYVNFTSDAKLLERAEVAMEARKYDKALDLAQQYTRRTDDWHGYLLIGRAQNMLGEHEAARSSLEQALARHQGAEIHTAVADSYAMPARKLLAQRGGDRAASVQQAIDLFAKARESIQKSLAADKQSVVLNSYNGLNYISLARAQLAQADALTKQADMDVAAGQPGQAAKRQEQATQARAQSQENYRQAAEVLLGVLQQDAAHSASANALAEVAVELHDAGLVERSRKLLAAVEPARRPPLAWGMLVLEDLPLQRYPVPEPYRGQCLSKLQEVEDLLTQHQRERLANDDLALLRRRMGEAYMRLDLPDQALMMFDRALAANSRDPLSQLLRGQLLAQKNELDAAQKQLYDLVSSYGEWAEGHYWYGQVAAQRGETMLALQSLRRATQLARTHEASRRAIIDILLAQTPPRAQEAYDDARELVELAPEQAGTIERFIKIALLLKRPELAEAQLEKLRKEHPNSPTMLWGVLQGYEQVQPDNRELRHEIAAQIAAATPTSFEDRLAQARALPLVGRSGQAQSLLMDLIKEMPHYAPLYYELGVLHDRAGRLFQANEYYGRAIELDRGNKLYNKAQARVMIQLGNVDTGNQIVDRLRQEDSQDLTAAMLDAQLDLMQQVAPAEVVQRLAKVLPQEQAVLLVAYSQLQGGKADECLTLCNEVLAKQPADLDMLTLQAQALSIKGRHAESAASYRKILEQRSDSMIAYLALAREVLGSLEPARRETVTPRDVVAAMQCTTPRQDLVQLAVAKTMEDLRRFDVAGGVYADLAKQPTAPADSRDQAKLRQALCLYTLGQADQCLTMLKALKTGGGIRAEAALAYANVMCNVGRGSEVRPDVQALWEQALQREDFRSAADIARLMVRAGAGELALLSVERMTPEGTKDVRPYRLQAYLLRLMGKDDKALPVYETILRLQSGDFNTYVQYAQALDRCQDAVGALKALEKLQSQGQSGQAQAVLARAGLMARWGLRSEAVRCYKQCEEFYRTSPTMMLALAQQYQLLGSATEARRVLAAVPASSPLRRQAQLQLAMAQDTPAQRLAALETWSKDRPMTPVTLELMMRQQVEMGQYQAALDRFAQAKLPARDLAASPASMLALQAMLELKQLSQATDLATAMAAENQPWWRQVATTLLAWQSKPQPARALLPAVEKASLSEAALGVVVATPEQIGPWYQRAVQVVGESPSLLDSQRASLRLLLHVAAGKKDEAAKELAALKGQGATVYDPAAELVASAGGAGASAEARKLLLASIAYNLEQPAVAQSLAMEVLQARPACQWAVILAMRSRDEKVLARAQELYADKSGPLGSRLAAMVAMARNDATAAVAPLEKALQQRAKDVDLQISLAEACQKAGKNDRALELYMQAMAAQKGSWAANNAAFLVTLLYAQDKPRLAEARKWIEQAIQNNPADHAVYDTAGWVAYLQGNTDQACRELHLAVKVLPQSPDVHYHVGMAHRQAGHASLAQLHLQQAVELGAELTKQGHPLAPETQQAVKLAQQALAQNNSQ